METEKEITERWLEEHVKPTYKVIATSFTPEMKDMASDYEIVLAALLNKGLTPRAFWAAEQGLKELQSPYRAQSQHGASTPQNGETSPKTAYNAPAGDYGGWEFAKGAKVTVAGEEAVVTWADGSEDTADLGMFHKKISKANNLYYQGFLDGKEVRILKTRLGWGVSVKGG